MKAKTLFKPFLVSLAALPVLFAVAVGWKGATAGNALTLTLFALTVFVELVAIVQFIKVRKSFSSADAGFLTWTLIIAFMLVRLVAEARLLSLTYNLVPEFKEGASSALYFYIIVLRYLYTVSDVLFIAALLTTIRSYKSTGLPFKLLPIDYVYILALCTLPVITFIFRENLIQTAIATSDHYIATYRLVAVSVGAIIGALCIVVRRYALQMGGGAVARVWNMVVIAGVARDGSFLALALISSWSKLTAMFVEQYLLWIFAGCWLLAALLQLAVFSRATKPLSMAIVESHG
jgi:hypothetical protein